MEISLILARIVGITLVCLYGGFLLNRDYYFTNKEALVKQPFMVLLSGIVALVFGLVLLQFHSIWTPDWRSFITLFAWLLFLSGVVRLFFPRFFLRIFDTIDGHVHFMTIFAVVFLLIGLYLTYVGFSGVV